MGHVFSAASRGQQAAPEPERKLIAPRRHPDFHGPRPANVVLLSHHCGSVLTTEGLAGYGHCAIPPQAAAQVFADLVGWVELGVKLLP
jgi:hypothetical protein